MFRIRHGIICTIIINRKFIKCTFPYLNSFPADRAKALAKTGIMTTTPTEQAINTSERTNTAAQGSKCTL
jgi:hypothetical protein